MKAIEIILKQAELNTKLFNNVLEGVEDENSTFSLHGKTNHLRWITGHLFLGRYRSIMRLGGTQEPYPHMDKYVLKDVPPPNARPMDLNIDYPDLQETLRSWNKTSPDLINMIQNLSDEKLNGEGFFTSPTGGTTLIENFAFLTHHEMYHIGQMGLLRKSFSYTPMSFK